MFQGLPHTIKMKHFVGDYLLLTISSRLSNSVLKSAETCIFYEPLFLDKTRHKSQIVLISSILKFVNML